ncbi:MAG TPA: PQQ-binding-like beta-propeller repeat protein [Gemmataceae bacterium]|nr:PQQ-binding-like beta-propeller repeat protein [Gemmataceae bacterium]
MKKSLLLAGAAILFVVAAHVSAEPDAITFGPDDWPWWRGPSRNGVADPNQKPPTKWSETENIVWKTPVPGRGHGSPILVGDQIFLQTADAKEMTKTLLCYSRTNGKLLWQKEIHRGPFPKNGNAKASHASSSVACDGKRVYINFQHNDAIYTTALTRDGEQVWQTKVADYTLHQGFASSPAIYKGLVIVSADNKSGKGALAGLDRDTGKIVWTVTRPKLPNYASPIILKVNGRDQLFFIGCKLVTSLDPLTGKKLWETDGSTEECVTSTVTDGLRIVSSGGYPKGHVAAILADGSAKTAWEHKTRVYVPSLLERGGYLYAVQDNGVPICWKFDTGKQQWQGDRIGSGFSASPVLVGENIYATSESGKTSIFKASPDSFQLIAENQLGNEVMATPTIAGSRIYMRVAVNQKGNRQEMLYCIGDAGR